jgi:hypothetical protein
MLLDVCRNRYYECAGCYWLDCRLIYAHLSFEFLYGDLLSRAVTHAASGPASFVMPGYKPGSFFGGPTAAIEALAETPDLAVETLFEPATGPLFASPFTGPPADLNLRLAAVIDEPVLHVIGDSHVRNCFTPTVTIGGRANVLTRTTDVSRTRVPYTHQFSHHLGSRTMHFAGRPGALPTVAKDCGLKAGDAAVWVFGEIDARSHILRQHTERGRTLDEIIGTLARDYVDGILEVHHAHDGIRSVVFAPIPPLDNAGYTSDDLPVCGTIEERIAATRQLSGALAALCDRHGLLFLDIAPHNESARGDLRWEMSDRFCHIDSYQQTAAVDALYELLAR